MAEVPTYPEAAGERDKYQRIIDSLNNERPAIQAAVNASWPADADFLPTVSVGDYCDLYETKTTEWLTKADNIRTRYTTFLTVLDNRIQRAIALRDMWARRINMTHTEN